MHDSSNLVTLLTSTTSNTHVMGKHHRNNTMTPQQKKMIAGKLFSYFASQPKRTHKKKHEKAPPKKPESDNPFKIFEYDPLNTKPIELPPRNKTPKTPKTPKTSPKNPKNPLESDNPFAKYAYKPSHK